LLDLSDPSDLLTTFLTTFNINLTFMPATHRPPLFAKAERFSATAFIASIAKPAWSRNLEESIKAIRGYLTMGDLAAEEAFWYYIQQSITVSPDDQSEQWRSFLGPIPVQEAVKRFYDSSNEAPRLLYVANS
jgi:hypothetical protein